MAIYKKTGDPFSAVMTFDHRFGAQAIYIGFGLAPAKWWPEHNPVIRWYFIGPAILSEQPVWMPYTSLLIGGTYIPILIKGTWPDLPAGRYDCLRFMSDKPPGPENEGGGNFPWSAVVAWSEDVYEVLPTRGAEFKELQATYI